MRGIWIAMALAAATGCDDGGGENRQPTGTICPQGGTALRYDDGTGTPDGHFGKDFMESNCTSCHASTLQGPVERHNAPDDHNFDTQQAIQAMHAHIDEVAGASQDGQIINTVMPPDGRIVTFEDRRKLSEWLSCGAP